MADAAGDVDDLDTVLSAAVLLHDNGQSTDMTLIAGPSTDRAEVRKDVPDFVRGSREGAGSVDVGHAAHATG